MKLLNDLVLNIILVMFPISIYFIYNCYRELKCEKYNKIILHVTLFTSLYLSLKYGNINTNSNIILFCNIPILIAYLKKQPYLAISLSIIVLIYATYIINNNIMFIALKFISYFIIYIIGKKRNIKDNTFIILISILQGFFISLEYPFILNNNNILAILELIITVVIFYIVPIILLYCFKLTDNITSLYQTVSNLEKDKQLKNSLFKITHEVKNPIAVCKGYLDMIDINNKDKLKRYIPIIKQEIDRSLNIMTDFMEFSKININKEILDINVLLEDIIEELKFLLYSKNIKLKTNITKDEIYTNGDYNRLKQVFINIIKNSIESISKDGEINITTHILNNMYYIEITDTGCGMDTYTLSKIKDLFFTTKKNGSGLGVSLSNEIIKAHNGEIVYKSKIDFGTKVVVKLPITMV